MNTYYDQNLFVRFNKVETQDSRYHPLRPEMESLFYDIVRVSPPLKSNFPYENTSNFTRDGVNFKEEKLIYFMAINFFYYENMILH